MSVTQTYNRQAPSLDEVATLYQFIGRAIWLIQNLEDALSNSLTIKIGLKDEQLGSVDHSVASAKLNRKRNLTLGQSVKISRQNLLYEDSLQERLNVLLDERNWLVHRLVHQSSDDMNVVTKREALFVRIHKILAEARELQNLIAEDLINFCVLKGADRKGIEDTAKHEFSKGRGLHQNA
jgi:hypothetical protein